MTPREPVQPVWLDPRLAVAEQLIAADFAHLETLGIRELVCLRPDDESGDYLTSAEARALAEQHGMRWRHAPVQGVDITPEALLAIEELIEAAQGTALAYCLSGRRVALAWAMVQVHQGRPVDEVLAATAGAGFDLGDYAAQLTVEAVADRRRPVSSAPSFDVVVVGGGTAGLGTIASLRKRRPELSIAVIEPSAEHHYQPGLTLVGTGWFDPARITRPEADLIPDGVSWIRQAATAFEPELDRVRLADGSAVHYRALVVAPGLTLDWDGITGAREALGQGGVCCNYSPQHAAYTWQQVQALRSGTALFTQPPMPIKCAGAPQKAMYLAADRWLHKGVLDGIDVQFHNAGAVLFGVEHFVPALMKYVERYDLDLHFGSRLTAIDGPGHTAFFERTDGDGAVETVAVPYDLLHFVPPQKSPAFIAASPLANASGWLDVAPHTLQHVHHRRVFGAGDVVGTSNAKTMAAARKHAPVVAENLLAELDGRELTAGYDGYGACPLTVEGGRVVLAEFGYGGALLPTFPLAPQVPRASQWMIKRRVMPWIYWNMMLKGREWFAEPRALSAVTDAA